jgi:hypothetical protein
MICNGSSHTSFPSHVSKLSIFLSLSAYRRQQGGRSQIIRTREFLVLYYHSMLSALLSLGTSSLGVGEEKKGGHNTQVSWTSKKITYLFFQVSFLSLLGR